MRLFFGHCMAGKPSLRYELLGAPTRLSIKNRSCKKRLVHWVIRAVA